MANSAYLYHNARIYTLDPARPMAEAVAVEAGRIVAVGNLSEVRALTPAGAEPVDLKGATLLPGLNDAHTHLLWWSHSLRKINLVGIDRLDRIAELVHLRAAVTPADSWVVGLGWDKNLWGSDFPTAETLDRAAPAHPVALISKDGHLLWVNSRAMQLCGITAETADPPGGQIERDAQGRPTGIFKETARALIDRHREKPDPAGDLAALREAMPLVHQAGLTGVHTVEGAEGLSAFQRLRESGGLRLRTTVLPYNHLAPGLIELGLRQGFGDEMLRLGQIKFFLDGTLGSQTAAMFEPFLEDTHADHQPDDCEQANTGILRMSEEDFQLQARHCLENGFAVAVHVIGDRAARLGLDVIERVTRSANTLSLPPGARNRLEHVQLLKAADLPRLASNKIIASVQPTHATTDCDTAERYWGLPRLNDSGRGYAYKSLLRSGVRLALGSDTPIEPIEPLNGLYAAVARRRPGDTRPAWLPHECLTIMEAVQGFSRDVAFAAGEEDRRGLLKPGFAADFTVLNQDLPGLPQSEILATAVVATVVAGEPVYMNI